MQATTNLPSTLQTILELVQSAHCSAVGVTAFLLMSKQCTEVNQLVWRKCSSADFESASYTCDVNAQRACPTS